MKFFFSLFLFYLISSHSYSQLLEGKWKGRFTMDYAGREMYNYLPIDLEFIISNDTLYSVFCYSQGHSSKKSITKVTSKVYYELFAKDSIYLSEIEIIDPPDALSKCLKKMYLKIIKLVFTCPKKPCTIPSVFNTTK